MPSFESRHLNPCTSAYLAPRSGKYEARDAINFAGNLTFVDWWDALGVAMPRPIVPICYGGKARYDKNHKIIKSWTTLVSCPLWAIDLFPRR